MKLQSIKLTLVIILGVLVISGCSHTNPLNQYSHESVARDLLASAVTAEMKLGLAKHVYQAGHYYVGCMAGKKDLKTCNRLYQLMSNNLRSKYKDVSASDLQDKHLWSYVKDYYQEAVFDRLPG